MFHFAVKDLHYLLTSYGYLAVLLFVSIESIGIPFPGETMLIIAATYAGTTQNLSIFFVILAAAIGAILGDNIGFFIGREGGFRLLEKYGPIIHIDERKIKLGLYLFKKHGGKVVFFGRFIAILRALAAFLAGTNRMSWYNFLIFNALGGVVWATIIGIGGYLLGNNIHRITGPFGIATLIFATLLMVIFFFILHKNQKKLEDEADKLYPGTLESLKHNKII